MPLSTQEAISSRREKGPQEVKKKNKINLKNYVIEILDTFEFGEVFLASDIFEQLPIDLQKNLKTPNRVTSTLINHLKDKVQKTGEVNERASKGRWPEYFKLIKK